MSDINCELSVVNMNIEANLLDRIEGPPSTTLCERGQCEPKKASQMVRIGGF